MVHESLTLNTLCKIIFLKKKKILSAIYLHTKTLGKTVGLTAPGSGFINYDGSLYSKTNEQKRKHKKRDEKKNIDGFNYHILRQKNYSNIFFNRTLRSCPPPP